MKKAVYQNPDFKNQSKISTLKSNIYHLKFKILHHSFSGIFLPVILILFTFTSHTSFSQINIDPSKIDIVRDVFGVPHIFAKTDVEVAYGLAWATCEDDFETLQWGLLAGKAMLGRYMGKDGAIIDYVNQLMRISDVVEEKFETSFSEGFRKIMEAYASGVNRYAELHKKEVLVKKAFPVTSKDMAKGYVLAMALMSQLDEPLRKILTGEINDADDRFRGIGSNAFAFNSNITADGNTYLAINSHQPIEGPLSWYEAHLCSEEGWNIVGGLFHGSVSILHGTNEHLGWAHTVNPFDPVDVFKLTMHPTEKNKYKFDGEWLELEESKAKLVVKLFDKFPLKLPVKKKIWWSKYGATLKTDNGVYSVKIAANEVIHAPEQWYHMNKATNFTEFRNILDMQGMARMTIVYADKYDTIYMLSNGLIPERTPGYNWKRVVPGDTSATLWGSYYPVNALPQLLNPDCGYIYNVNNSPFEATCVESDIDTATCDPNTGFCITFKTNRSIRFMEMMQEYEGKLIDWNDFLKIKYDARMPDSMIFINDIDINAMKEINPVKYPDIADVLEKMHRWNRIASTDNEDAAISLYIFMNLLKESTKRFHTYDVDAVAREEMFVRCLRKAKKEMLEHFGTIDVPLGKVQLLMRGDKEYPVGGFPDAIKAAYSQPVENGRYKLWVGESYIQLVKFTKDGPQIESISPFGAANKPGHPHSTDQMELFVNEKTKTMTLDKATVYREAKEIYQPK